MSFDQIRVVRFNDGTTIVAYLEDNYSLSGPFINLMYPIEVYTNGIDDYGEHMSESYMLKTWIGLSDDIAFTIPTSSVMVISNLDASHKLGFEKCVQKLFVEEKQQNQNKRTEEQFSDVLSPDDLLDYIEAKEKNKIN